MRYLIIGTAALAILIAGFMLLAGDEETVPHARATPAGITIEDWERCRDTGEWHEGENGYRYSCATYDAAGKPYWQKEQ